MVHKEIKTDIITIFHIFEKLQEGLNMWSRGKEGIKKMQIKFLEIKIKIAQIKSTPDEINCRSDITEKN